MDELVSVEGKGPVVLVEGKGMVIPIMKGFRKRVSIVDGYDSSEVN